MARLDRIGPADVLVVLRLPAAGTYHPAVLRHVPLSPGPLARLPVVRLRLLNHLTEGLASLAAALPHLEALRRATAVPNANVLRDAAVPVEGLRVEWCLPNFTAERTAYTGEAPRSLRDALAAAGVPLELAG